MIDTSTIEEHMEVVGSDGMHVSTVDNVGIKLTKGDVAAHGQHHYINIKYVASVEGGKLKLNIPAEQAIMEEKAVEN